MLLRSKAAVVGDAFVKGPRVSADILLLIVDAVGTDPSSHATLTACALTCQAIRRRAQVLLFSNIELSSRKQCKNLGRLIYDRPDFGQLVERITVDCRKGWTQRTFKDHPLPPHVVVRFTSLKAATFIGFSDVAVPLENGSGDRTIVSFVTTFATLTTLEELALREITFLHTHSPVEYFLRPLWGNAITNLDIMPWDIREDRDLSNYTGLKHFTRLERLELGLHAYNLPMHWLNTILTYVRSKSIRELVINYQPLGHSTAVISPDNLDDFTLGEDESAGLATWPHLEKVRWVVRCYEADEAECTAIARKLEETIPAPWLRGIFASSVEQVLGL
ncbi:hypothetical protein C8T65DRAFT_745086 [Cerioporus squamosus]|nr:hypothetical protein C8T65DRAFT_745086 [Cerioporus squamosus]